MRRIDVIVLGIALVLGGAAFGYGYALTTFEQEVERRAQAKVSVVLADNDVLRIICAR